MLDDVDFVENTLMVNKALLPLILTVAALCGTAAATTLHPGDRVAVTVYNHPELSTQATVDSAGRIAVPVAGAVDAATLTPSQTADRIRDRLAPYVRKVAVAVDLVAQGQNIFVAGGPGGVLTYAPGETLIGALGQIQSGINATAGSSIVPTDPSVVAAHQLQYGSIDLHHIVIARDGHDLPPVDAAALIAKGDPGPALAPDDTLKLAQNPIAVSVTGDVKQPGVAHLNTEQSLSAALDQVGGVDDASSSRQFVLTRNGTTKTVTTSSVEYRSPAQDGDAIFVPHGLRVGVLGQVVTPHEVLLQGDSSLLSALYYAGGPTKYGDLRHVNVVHQGVSTSYDVANLTHGANDQNPTLSDGDTVFVPEGHRIDFSLLFQAIIASSYLRFL